MHERREFLTATLTGLAASLLAAREASAAPSSRPVAQKDAPKVNLDGWQLTATEISYPPGESSGPHRHTGFVIGYVLEGLYGAGVSSSTHRSVTVAGRPSTRSVGTTLRSPRSAPPSFPMGL